MQSAYIKQNVSAKFNRGVFKMAKIILCRLTHNLKLCVTFHTGIDGKDFSFRKVVLRHKPLQCTHLYNKKH